MICRLQGSACEKSIRIQWLLASPNPSEDTFQWETSADTLLSQRSFRAHKSSLRDSQIWMKAIDA